MSQSHSQTVSHWHSKSLRQKVNERQLLTQSLAQTQWVNCTVIQSLTQSSIQSVSKSVTVSYQQRESISVSGSHTSTLKSSMLLNLWRCSCSLGSITWPLICEYFRKAQNFSRPYSWPKHIQTDIWLLHNTHVFKNNWDACMNKYVHN